MHTRMILFGLMANEILHNALLKENYFRVYDENSMQKDYIFSIYIHFSKSIHKMSSALH